MTHDEDAFLTECYQALKDEPLKPDDPNYSDRYVLIFERLHEVDPVRPLEKQIRYAGSESVQFLAGFRGSGKTTQFFRLQSKLEQDPDGNTVVLYAGALQYMSPAEPLEVPHFLIALAAAFGEATDKRLETSTLQKGYFTRIKDFLTNTEVEVTGIGASVSTGPIGTLLAGSRGARS